MTLSRLEGVPQHKRLTHLLHLEPNKHKKVKLLCFDSSKFLIVHQGELNTNYGSLGGLYNGERGGRRIGWAGLGCSKPTTFEASFYGNGLIRFVQEKLIVSLNKGIHFNSKRGLFIISNCGSEVA